jgi:hypothetical protein
MSDKKKNSEEEYQVPVPKERKNWVLATSEDLNFDIEQALENAYQPIKTEKDLTDRLRLLAAHIKKFIQNQKKLRISVARYFLIIRDEAKRMGYKDHEIKDIAYAIFRDYEISDTHIRRVIPHELKTQSNSNIRYQGEDKDAPDIEDLISEDDDLVTEHVREAPQLTNMSQGNTQSELGQFDFPETYATDNAAPGERLGNDTQIQLRNAMVTIQKLENKVRELQERIKNSVMIGQEVQKYSGVVELDSEHRLPITIAINLLQNKIEYIEMDTEAMRKTQESLLK